MSFASVMDTVGKGFAKGLQWAVTYAIPVEKLVGLLFPSVAPASAAAVAATSLIQTAVLLVEQKYAAAGIQSGTGAQKLAEVTLLAEPVVMNLLTEAGIVATTPYVQNVISAVVAILNAQLVQSTSATGVTA